MELFEEITASEHLQPFVLSKLAISLSIKNSDPLSEKDFNRDTNGLELNRQTITGEHDLLFKALIEMRERRHLEDDEYFQKYLRAHLNRGAKLLHREYRYGRDFLLQILNSDDNI